MQGFITLLYHRVLGREPDIEGLGYWQSVLEGNLKSASQIAECFFFSEENISRVELFDNSDFIEYLYYSVLFREFDEGGYDSCLNCMNAGLSKQDLFNSFVASDEWLNLCIKFNINP